MIRLSLCLWLLAACGAGQPPAGPVHVADSSAQADTPCPKERKKAQEARELLLGADDAQLVKSAAIKVLAQAHCEMRALQDAAVPIGTHERIVGGLRDLRERVQGVNNLFVEVLRYEVPGLHGSTFLDQGELKTLFANKVASITPPSELDGPTKLEFEAELGEAIALLRAEGEVLAERGCANLVEQGLEDERCP